MDAEDDPAGEPRAGLDVEDPGPVVGDGRRRVGGAPDVGHDADAAVGVDRRCPPPHGEGDEARLEVDVPQQRLVEREVDADQAGAVPGARVDHLRERLRQHGGDGDHAELVEQARRVRQEPVGVELGSPQAVDLLHEVGRGRDETAEALPPEAVPHELNRAAALVARRDDFALDDAEQHERSQRRRGPELQVVDHQEVEQLGSERGAEVDAFQDVGQLTKRPEHLGHVAGDPKAVRLVQRLVGPGLLREQLDQVREALRGGGQRAEGRLDARRRGVVAKAANKAPEAAGRPEGHEGGGEELGELPHEPVESRGHATAGSSAGMTTIALWSASSPGTSTPKA